MNRYRIELEELSAFVERLQAFEQRAETIAADFDKQVAQLHCSWHGSAAEAHQSHHQQWTAAAAQMREATPLHSAASGDNVAVVRLLLDAGAEVNAQSNAGDTPIYSAIRNTTPAAGSIQRLLRERGGDPTIANEKGHSALRFVQRYGTPEMKETFADLL